ncbi:hypothetical protein V6N12_012701 [Hibiscus sabdariffa]|uniref:Uncharacterized protein n=1 Tax=Hibiscus sabdariffa TaxID=183260 RepID=A0ABR2DEA8_9ROSI
MLPRILARGSSELPYRVQHVEHDRLKLKMGCLYLWSYYSGLRSSSIGAKVITNSSWSCNFLIYCSILILLTANRLIRSIHGSVCFVPSPSLMIQSLNL